MKEFGGHFGNLCAKIAENRFNGKTKIMRAWGTHKMSENIMFSDKTAKVKFKNITHKMSV